jgi:hypothetical protein
MALNVESLTLHEFIYLFLLIREFITASTNIAVKNKLKDGINIGYQSF